MTVIVTWMDGQQETYRCKGWNVENGLLLWLIPLPNRPPADHPGRCIPLVNVRVWTVS
jgi:hypothetical protein